VCVQHFPPRSGRRGRWRQASRLEPGVPRGRDGPGPWAGPPRTCAREEGPRGRRGRARRCGQGAGRRGRRVARRTGRSGRGACGCALRGMGGLAVGIGPALCAGAGGEGAGASAVQRGRPRRAAAVRASCALRALPAARPGEALVGFRAALGPSRLRPARGAPPRPKYGVDAEISRPPRRPGPALRPRPASAARIFRREAHKSGSWARGAGQGGCPGARRERGRRGAPTGSSRCEVGRPSAARFGGSASVAAWAGREVVAKALVGPGRGIGCRAHVAAGSAGAGPLGVERGAFRLRRTGRACCQRAPWRAANFAVRPIFRRDGPGPWVRLPGAGTREEGPRGRRGRARRGGQGAGRRGRRVARRTGRSGRGACGCALRGMGCLAVRIG